MDNELLLTFFEYFLYVIFFYAFITVALLFLKKAFMKPKYFKL